MTAKTNVSKEEEIFDSGVKEWLEETKTPRYKHVTEHLIKILNDLNLKDKYILELGCGVSPYFKHLSGNNLYGLDISKKLLGMNKCRKAILIHGDLLKCSKYFQRKFDLVFMAGVMHHIHEKDHKIAVREIKKIMKSSGKLIIVEPNMVSITGLFYIIRKILEKILPKRVLVNFAGFGSEEERYIFPSKFSKVLRKKGFKILDQYTIGLIRLPPCKVLKNLSIEGINKKIDFFLKKFKIGGGTTVIFVCEKW